MMYNVVQVPSKRFTAGVEKWFKTNFCLFGELCFIFFQLFACLNDVHNVGKMYCYFNSMDFLITHRTKFLTLTFVSKAILAIQKPFL